MATVTLAINPGEKAVSDLPCICMKCGAPAMLVRKKKFFWNPPWLTTLWCVLLVPLVPLFLCFAMAIPRIPRDDKALLEDSSIMRYSILMMLLVTPMLIAAAFWVRARCVEMPFCDRHENYWIIRDWIQVGSLLFLLGAWGVFRVWLDFKLRSDAKLMTDGGDYEWFRRLMALPIVPAVVSSLVGTVLRWTTIRATKITNREITLANVSPEFARVLKEAEEVLNVSDRWPEHSRRAHRPDDTRIDRGPRA